MKLHEFAQLVREMREAQRQYFRDRSPQALSKAKEFERRVDQAAQDVLDAQKKLF